MPTTSRDIMVVQVGLKKMWDSGYFDICTIDKACTILSLIPERRIYEQLRMLHCVHFCDMDTETLKEVKAMVVELFDFDRVMDPVIDLNPNNVIVDHTGSRTLTPSNILGDS